MTPNSSHRPTREGPLMLVAVALVCAVCIPLWQASAPRPEGQEGSKWTAERLSRLFLGPEQAACYFCFAWAGFILLSRYREVRRQQRAFDLNLLPTEAGVRILPEDAWELKRRVERRSERGGPFLLTNMIRLALGKYAASRSARDVSDTIRTQADVDLGRMVSSMSTVHYLAWAIPAIGFLGTVRGLAASLTMGNRTGEELERFIRDATSHLNVAFDCTLIALGLSLILMFLLHSVQRDEEALVLDCQQYCLEHLNSRLYEIDAGATPGYETHGAPGFVAPLTGME